MYLDKFKKCTESLMLLPLAALLIITPLLSTSLRFKYLYFIVNILLIAVAIEAGLLSFFLKSEENKKSPASASASVVDQKPVIISEVSPAESDNGTKSPDKSVIFSGVSPAESDDGTRSLADKSVVIKKLFKVVEKVSLEKIIVAVKVPSILCLKKVPSIPSLFFIGGGERTEAEEEMIEDINEGEEVGELSGQELFQKAETFIGNFYKQLKMQRQESSKKLSTSR